jgi:hypothetical protein
LGEPLEADDTEDDDDFLGAPILTGTTMRAIAAREAGGAGEADLLGLSSKRSPATLPTGRLRVFRLIYALALANIPFLGEPMRAGATARGRSDGADDAEDDAEDDDSRDDAGEDDLLGAGEADLLGLSSKRSPATLPTGRLRVFRPIYALALAIIPFLGEPMRAGATARGRSDGADDAEDDDLRDDAGEDDLLGAGEADLLGAGEADLLGAGEADLLGAGEADLLGLSSKRSPTTLPTGSL